MTNSPVPEPVDLTDPTISAHRLQELAQTHPNQWDEILAHPNVYPGLSDWIRNRQAELAATGTQQPDQDEGPQLFEDTADDEATQVFAQPGDADATKVFAQPFGAASTEPADAGEQPTAETIDTASEPDVASEREAVSAPEPAAESDADAAAPSEATPFTAPEHTWAGPDQQFATPETRHTPPGAFQGYHQPGQDYHQPGQGYPQPGFGQAQHFGQQPYLMPQRKPSPVDVHELGTWALFFAGGAAFMSLFGFAFEPSSTLYTSHMAAGGWFILLLMLGTVVLSILQLLKPSRWMRFFFLAVSLGAGFMMFSRAINYIGFFTLRGTNFSVVWLLFMSLVLLAAALVYLAPRGANDGVATTPPAQPPYGAPQHFSPGQTPYSGYGPGPGQYGGYGQPGDYRGPQQ